MSINVVNFVVSGYSTQWYYLKDNEAPSYMTSIKLLLRYHWGSVMGGSLILGFFYFGDFLINFLLGSDKVKIRTEGKQGIDEDRVAVDQGKCYDFFSLVRSESMAYINIINFPYCNASRYC